MWMSGRWNAARFARGRSQSIRSSSCHLAAVNNSPFHYEADLFQHRNVFEGIALHGDDVSKFARLQAADFMQLTKQGCATNGCRLDGLHRSHACFNEVTKV